MRWVNIKLINCIFKSENLDYNEFKENSYQVCETGNPYGHVKEFIRLNKRIRHDAHRVISPLAVRLSGIEEIYTASDINGNTYKFDIFEEGNYRINQVIKLKNYVREVMHETNINKNS